MSACLGKINEIGGTLRPRLSLT